ncbi:sensor histidine kinase [Natrarchaeobius halalkaliphilus]|uniref:histidine kinase n=1 Tax=Natrarchaeobius halalkaliphilus TaxID=1679091 RepID=A0A3N6MCD9_9EURY|nr:HAMP domain-containing sensor histidine kinase [Natrarchaeobius halalkaliphilus]RQG91386.1 sensor histidine kinase [Natrarchaeobius halalkaliphilus]
MNRDSRRATEPEATDQKRCERSFDVLSVDGPETRTRITEAFESRYRFQHVTSPSSIEEELEDGVDCLVVGDGLATDEACSVLEDVHESRSSPPVIYVSSSLDPAIGRALLEIERAEIVSKDGADSLTRTDVKRLQACLDEQYHRSISDVREVVLEVSRSLMGAASDETDIEIEWGLQLVGRQLDADRCLVFEYDEGVLEPTYCWDAPSRDADDDGASSGEPRPVGIAVVDEPSVDVPAIDAESFPGFDTLSQSFDPYAVPPEMDDEFDIEVPDDFVGSLGVDGSRNDEIDGQDPIEHPYFRARGLESILATPIVVDWELEGILLIEQRTKRPWPRSLRQQVQTVGELVGYTHDRDRRRRELARKNERLERFISVISHDLRNPLNILRGYADLIEETGDPSHATDVVVAAERMETMIDDLLTLARQDEDVREPDTVDLEETVRAAWNAVETEQSKLETGSIGPVDGNRSRLQQAFENLFRNAVEHAGPSVTVRVLETERGFAVEDDGPGIPSERRDRVFQEGHSSGDGTGLGLSIVAAVADAHGWTVTAGSADSGGARFEFRISQNETDRRSHDLTRSVGPLRDRS